MIRNCAVALGVAALALSPVAYAAEIEIEVEGPVVELTIFETIDVEPDMATISAGVTTQAQTATAALRQNSVEMRSVIDRIKALGIDEKDIQTSGINLSPRYDYNRQTQQQVFRGYQVTNRVSVKLREIDETGEVLDALVAAGATDIGGPNFSVEDDSAQREIARTRALERGKQRAIAYANLSGFDDVRLLEISEALMGSGPMPMPVMRDAVENSIQVAAAPVQPGMISTGVSVTVKYEMVSADTGHTS